MADIRSLTVRSERWPIAGAFTISRGSKTEAEVVVAELTDGTICGRGECVPYARYGETIAGVAAAIAGLAEDDRLRPRPHRPPARPARRGGAQCPRLRVHRSRSQAQRAAGP